MFILVGHIKYLTKGPVVYNQYYKGMYNQFTKLPFNIFEENKQKCTREKENPVIGFMYQPCHVLISRINTMANKYCLFSNLEVLFYSD